MKRVIWGYRCFRTPPCDIQGVSFLEIDLSEMDRALGHWSNGGVFPGERETVLDEFEGETGKETKLGSQGWNLQM